MPDMKDLAIKRSGVNWLDPRILKVEDGLNARDLESAETKAHIEDLALSIAEVGVRKPLEVFGRGEDIFVADGHCRLAAVMLAISRGADIKAVPTIPEDRGTDETARKLNQVTSNSGKPLSLSEVGAIVKFALAKGWEIPAIAKRLGKSTTYLNNALDALGAPAEVKQAVKSGEVSETQALKTVQRLGPEKAVEAVREAVSTAKTQGKTKATAKHFTTPPPAPRKASDAENAQRVGELSTSLVKISVRGPSLVGVKIVGEEIVRSKQFWTDLARRLIAECEA